MDGCRDGDDDDDDGGDNDDDDRATKLEHLDEVEEWRMLLVSEEEWPSIYVQLPSSVCPDV